MSETIRGSGVPTTDGLESRTQTVSRWIRLVGWACVAGSAGACVVIWRAIGEVRSWHFGPVSGGFIDVSLPSPAAIAIVLWELGHIWVIVLAAAIVRGKLRHLPLVASERVLLASLVGAVIAAGILDGELLHLGVTIGVPGVDHHLGWWRL